MYLLIFIVMAWMAASHMQPQPVGVMRRKLTIPWVAVYMLLTLLIGLRYEVGGDWFSYLYMVEQIQGVPFAEFSEYGDPAYTLLNWVGANVGGSVYLTNTVAATLFVWGLMVFARSQPRPWLVMVVAVPYLITVVAMGYTRQGVAIGFAMVGLTALLDGRQWRFFGWIVLAALFHKTAVLLVPLAIFSKGKGRWLTVIGGLVTGAVFYVLLLQESVDNLVVNYVEAGYASSGAAIRVAMNALPALLFILFRRRFPLTEAERGFWGWMALSALGFVALLYLSPSSTAVDRVALYWIPIQLFVWARVPDAFGKPGQRNPGWTWLVIAYSAAALLVWLLFAVTSFAWLPYRFYPWELLFS